MVGTARVSICSVSVLLELVLHQKMSLLLLLMISPQQAKDGHVDPSASDLLRTFQLDVEEAEK